MTIQVINDFVALQQPSPADQWKIKDDEAESYLRFRKKSYEEDDDYTANTSISSKDSDDDSVLSNASSSVASPSRVSFCEELITMEWTRPYTEPEDIPLLYYSTEETNRFRHEYRLERKMLSALDVDDALLAVDDELSEGCSTSTRLRKILTVNSSTCDVHQSESSSLSTASSEAVSPSSALRRAISRVVVLHNDKIASFSESSFSNDGNASPDFFDTPEFWSGSITWW